MAGITLRWLVVFVMLRKAISQFSCSPVSNSRLNLISSDPISRQDSTRSAQTEDYQTQCDAIFRHLQVLDVLRRQRGIAEPVKRATLHRYPIGFQQRSIQANRNRCGAEFNHLFPRSLDGSAQNDNTQLYPPLTDQFQNLSAALGGEA